MSATNVTVQNFNIGLSGLVSGVSGLGTIQLPLPLNTLISAAMSNGFAAANKVNQLYQVQTTLAASASIDYNLYTFGGAVDAIGNAFTMAVVKLLIFQNLGVAGAAVEADYIKVGGKGTTAGWTSFFGTNTDTAKIFSGPATAANPNPNPGTLVIWDPGQAGYAVGNSSTNNILTLTAGANSGACTYNLIVVGATS